MRTRTGSRASLLEGVAPCSALPASARYSALLTSFQFTTFHQVLM